MSVAFTSKAFRKRRLYPPLPPFPVNINATIYVYNGGSFLYTFYGPLTQTGTLNGCPYYYGQFPGPDTYDLTIFWNGAAWQGTWNSQVAGPYEITFIGGGTPALVPGGFYAYSSDNDGGIFSQSTLQIFR